MRKFVWRCVFAVLSILSAAAAAVACLVAATASQGVPQPRAELQWTYVFTNADMLDVTVEGWHPWPMQVWFMLVAGWLAGWTKSQTLRKES